MTATTGRVFTNPTDPGPLTTTPPGLFESLIHRPVPRMLALKVMGDFIGWNSSTECCQEFPAADPDRSGWNPTLQVPDSASVFDLKIPPPDLRPEIRPSRSSSEDIEALNPIVLDTTEPYQTTIMLSHADTRLPRNVSFEKAQIPSYAEATAIENLPRTSPPAVSSQHTMFAHDSSPEATGSTTSGSSAVVFMPNHELRPISFQEMAQTSSWLPRRASRCSSVHQRREDVPWPTISPTPSRRLAPGGVERFNEPWSGSPARKD
ncbi:hypothetical protein MRX96_003624 [Rhipicephalus microplus]